jgi:acyl carrier protein
MNDKLKNEIIEVVKSVMNIDITNLDGKTKFSSMPDWDSFNNLMLISKFQEEYKIEFTAVEIEETQKIEDLFELIERKVSPN